MVKNTILSLLMITLFQLQASAYTVETIPSPLRNNSYLSNPDQIISPEDEKLISQKLRDIEKNFTHEVAIVAVNTIGNEVPKNFAVKLFEKWGIGKKTQDNGVLILLVMDQRRVEIEVGYGLEGILTDYYCHYLIQNHLIPHIKEGKIGPGLLVGLEEFEKVFQDGGKDPVLDHLPPPETDYAPYFIFSFLGIALLGFLRKIKTSAKGILTGLLFIGGVLFINIAPWTLLLPVGAYLVVNGLYLTKLCLHKRKALINFIFNKPAPFRPNIIELLFFFPTWAAIYGYKHQLKKESFLAKALNLKDNFLFIEEEIEDFHLTPAQQKEEELGAVEHEVYFNKTTGETRTASKILPFTKYSKCQSCGTMASLCQSSRTIEAATSHSSGSAMDSYECLFCKAKYEVERIILASRVLQVAEALQVALLQEVLSEADPQVVVVPEEAGRLNVCVLRLIHLPELKELPDLF